MGFTAEEYKGKRQKANCRLGLLTDEAVASPPLSKLARQTLKNHRGDEVGEVRPAFRLSDARA